MDGYKKQMDGWMDIKNRWIKNGRFGWIDKMDGWMDKNILKNRMMFGWIEKNI